jgi:hypothetical protein
LEPKAEEHLFIGVAENVKAWKYLILAQGMFKLQGT